MRKTPTLINEINELCFCRPCQTKITRGFIVKKLKIFMGRMWIFTSQAVIERGPQLQQGLPTLP